jgi:hypothetical protein
VIILTEGLHGIIWQSTTGYLAPAPRGSCASFAVNGNLPVIPSVQAFVSAKPNAAIPGRQDGTYGGARQALLDRNCGDGEVAKSVEAIRGSYPNIAFAILKEICNLIA